MAKFIYNLHSMFRIDLEKFHVIGHSVGAHVAGFAGKDIQELTGGEKLARITALDAAGPLFTELFLVNQKDRLTNEDANLVVALHTAGGTLGISHPIGTIDFYANGGTPPQPGCTIFDTRLSIIAAG